MEKKKKPAREEKSNSADIIVISIHLIIHKRGRKGEER